MEDQDVEFIEVENQEVKRPFSIPFYSPTIEWLVKKGIARDKKAANKLAFMVISTFFMLSFFFFYLGFTYNDSNSTNTAPSSSNGFTIDENS